MPRSQQAGTESSDPSGPLLIVVVRSGGFAGLRREWRIEPPAQERSDWVVLIEACPWGSVRADPASRDRFVWSIEARLAPASGARKATVPEKELVGPWKELVDRVQHAEAGSAGSETHRG